MRILVLVLFGLVLACGDWGSSVSPADSTGIAVTLSPTAARAELDRRRISYDAAEFVVAAQVGNLAVVQLFVQAGMSVDTAWVGGETALHRAVSHDRLAVVRYLVGQGANLEATDYDGWTALHWAAWRGRLSFVRYLVEQGARIEARDNYGGTALHKAARWGHLAVVEYLVARGLYVNAKTDEGWTARDVAEQNGHADVVEYLEWIIGAGKARVDVKYR